MKFIRFTALQVIKCTTCLSTIHVYLIATMLFGLIGNICAQQKPMLMWFDKPAYQPKVFTYDVEEFKRDFRFEERGWVEALPVGNSRLGAMVFGGVSKEHIQLN